MPEKKVRNKPTFTINTDDDLTEIIQRLSDSTGKVILIDNSKTDYASYIGIIAELKDVVEAKNEFDLKYLPVVFEAGKGKIYAFYDNAGHWMNHGKLAILDGRIYIGSEVYLDKNDVAKKLIEDNSSLEEFYKSLI